MTTVSQLHGLSSKHRREALRRGLSYLLLGIFSLSYLTPFFWMISTSLKKQMAVYLFPPQWIPSPPQWSNYVGALSTWPMGIYFTNTLIITTANILGHLLSSSLAAYAFARLRAPGRNIIFIIVLATMMLPYPVTMVPLFILFRDLHWINTFLPLIVPSFFGNPFFIFLLRQFFQTIPSELEDAARIDGCSSLRIFTQIVLPLSKPALITVAIFAFVWNWNDFLGPLIYLNNESKRTIALALMYFTGSDVAGPQLHYLMAVAVMTLMPVLVIFFALQRYYIRGIIFTGIKG